MKYELLMIVFLQLMKNKHDPGKIALCDNHFTYSRNFIYKSLYSQIYPIILCSSHSSHNYLLEHVLANITAK